MRRSQHPLTQFISGEYNSGRSRPSSASCPLCTDSKNEESCSTPCAISSSHHARRCSRSQRIADRSDSNAKRRRALLCRCKRAPAAHRLSMHMVALLTFLGRDLAFSIATPVPYGAVTTHTSALQALAPRVYPDLPGVRPPGGPTEDDILSMVPPHVAGKLCLRGYMLLARRCVPALLFPSPTWQDECALTRSKNMRKSLKIYKQLHRGNCPSLTTCLDLRMPNGELTIACVTEEQRRRIYARLGIRPDQRLTEPLPGLPRPREVEWRETTLHDFFPPADRLGATTGEHGTQGAQTSRNAALSAAGVDPAPARDSVSSARDAMGLEDRLPESQSPAVFPVRATVPVTSLHLTAPVFGPHTVEQAVRNMRRKGDGMRGIAAPHQRAQLNRLALLHTARARPRPWQRSRMRPQSREQEGRTRWSDERGAAQGHLIGHARARIGASAGAAADTGASLEASSNRGTRADGASTSASRGAGVSTRTVGMPRDGDRAGEGGGTRGKGKAAMIDERTCARLAIDGSSTSAQRPPEVQPRPASGDTSADADADARDQAAAMQRCVEASARHADDIALDIGVDLELSLGRSIDATASFFDFSTP